MQKTMNEYVLGFADQVKEAIDIADAFHWNNEWGFQNVLIAGLGGSGIGGTILAQLIADHCNVPVQSIKGYTLPAYVNENTLVIACSYSGNTEETLEVISQSVDQGAHIACISSGGKLCDMALQHHWPLLKVPGGSPPRAAFGYAIVQLFRFAEIFGLTSAQWRADMIKAVELIEDEEKSITAAARQLAESLQHKLPVIYSSGWLEGIAIRWRQQINENSKTLSWHNVYPEMNHNELVGWAGGSNNLGVIFLLSDYDHPRVARRMELSEQVYTKKTRHIHHYRAKGKSRIEQAIYLIHLGDWFSVYLADFKQVNSTEIEVIDWLKAELAEF
ncbi:MAG: bifunctional phosphoglucose/phosphomannose isomerase [Salibacteraceae bacterium]